MRQKLLRVGASELKYEIRGIVEKAEKIKANGQEILWENIGDPIQKHCQVPEWMKDTIKDLLSQNDTYSYSHSKGVPETRKYLAKKTNELKGVQINSEDILFFNGLGDAISKIYDYILPTSRIIGPSPAYSTHSSAEAAHANHEPITYNLDPANKWYPDLDDLYNKIKYNPSIVGILIINPDNPTGMVYPVNTLNRIVEMAREFDLFLISDEIYQNITYNNTEVVTLAEVIGDVPGIALKGVSKEFPWPGARCGWAEFYNRKADPDFDKLCTTLENAKMIEGRFINVQDEAQVAKVAIIGNKIKKDVFNTVETPIGEFIAISGIPFKIIGVYKEYEDREEERIYIPITTAQRIFNGGDKVNNLSYTLPPVENFEQAVEQAVAFKENLRGYLQQVQIIAPEDTSALEVWSAMEEAKRYYGLTNNIKLFFWFVGVCTIIAGVVGVSNIMLIVVRERTREIGIRKAMGAKPWSIIGMILQEAVFITTIAGFTGFIVSMGLLELVGPNIEIDYVVNPSVDFKVAMTMVVVLILAGTLAGFVPAWRAAKIQVIEALRDE